MQRFIRLLNYCLNYFGYEVVEIEYDDEEEDELYEETNHIVCNHCGKMVFYTVQNTQLIVFRDYIWYSAANTECDYCEYKQAVFILERLDWELEWAKNNGLDIFVIAGIPPEAVLQAFSLEYPNMPIMHNLDKKEEFQVSEFAFLLETEPYENWFKPPE